MLFCVHKGVGLDSASDSRWGSWQTHWHGTAAPIVTSHQQLGQGMKKTQRHLSVDWTCSTSLIRRDYCMCATDDFEVGQSEVYPWVSLYIYITCLYTQCAAHLVNMCVCGNVTLLTWCWNDQLSQSCLNCEMIVRDDLPCVRCMMTMMTVFQLAMQRLDDVSEWWSVSWRWCDMWGSSCAFSFIKNKNVY